MDKIHPIGVFDSGYGGLTVLKEIVKTLPAYDYIYLGDNARAPYGPRSFDTVYRYTWQCVEWFFRQGCPLVILACNTASAKALRSIEQKDLEKYPGKNVLGVIRPTTELIGNYSKTKSVGILGTQGTVISNSYPIEIAHLFPDLNVYQQACPMWVPLIENNEYETEGADFFIKKNLEQLLEQSSIIDTVLLACTHYPILKDKLEKLLPSQIKLLSQGDIVSAATQNYLQRHPEIETKLSRQGKRYFYTTDSPEDFDVHARVFFGEPVASQHTDLDA